MRSLSNRQQAVPIGGMNSGAYILWVELSQEIALRIGSLGEAMLPKGQFLYVGSAHKNLAQRIARHQRLDKQKSGNLHWHIDYLLTHPKIRLIAAIPFPNGNECEISRNLAVQKGVTVPIAHFGATDCRSGCPAHLYHLIKKSKEAVRGLLRDVSD
jgi:Uri superfamily endonuclease